MSKVHAAFDFRRLVSRLSSIPVRSTSIDALLDQFVDLTSTELEVPVAVWVEDRPGELKRYRTHGLDSQVVTSEMMARIDRWAVEASQREDFILQDCDSEAGFSGCVILFSLRSRLRSFGVFGLFLPFGADETDAESEAGFQQLAQTLSQLLTSWEEQYLRTDYRQTFHQLSSFVVAVTRQPNLTQAATVAVDHLRPLAGVERVIYLDVRSGQAIPLAASGVARVGKSLQLKSLAKLGRHVVRSGLEFTYNGTQLAISETIQQQLSDYIQKSKSTFLKIVPLFDSLADPPVDSSRRPTRQNRKVLGLLVFERFHGHETPSRLLDLQAEFVGSVEAIFARLRDFERIPFPSIFRTLGSGYGGLKRSTLAKVSLIVLVLAALSTALTVVQTTRTIAAEGVVVATRSQQIFATRDAVISRIFVTPGSRVEVGQPLLTLDDYRLRAEIGQLVDELAREDAEQQSLQTTLLQISSAEKVQRLQLQSNLAKLKLRIAAGQQELALLKQEQERMTVVAPISGIVSNLSDIAALEQKPVSRGESLFEIIDDISRREIEIYIPEVNLGYLYKSVENSPGQPQLAAFQLLADPDRTFSGTLQIPQASQLSLDSEQPYLKCTLTPEDPALMSELGATVHARIPCGRDSLFHVWFDDFLRNLSSQYWWTTF